MRTKIMDFRILNPVIGHSQTIGRKTKEWGGIEDNILDYLCDVERLEQFADMAIDSEQLASYIDPFLTNAEKYFTAMEEMSEGQVKWTELRKKFGDKVAQSLLKIRKLDADFTSNLEQIDAQDRSEMARIEQKRKHGLLEIATTLNHDLQAELFRHQNKMNDIESREKVAAERQEIQQGIKNKRQSLMERVKRGTRGNNPPSDKVNVG